MRVFRLVTRLHGHWWTLLLHLMQQLWRLPVWCCMAAVSCTWVGSGRGCTPPPANSSNSSASRASSCTGAEWSRRPCKMVRLFWHAMLSSAKCCVVMAAILPKKKAASTVRSDILKIMCGLERALAFREESGGVQIGIR